MLKARLIPLSEEQILKLPFPETARKVGGVIVFEDDSLEHHLNVEEFRRLWNESIKNSPTVFRTTIIGNENET